MEIANIRQTLSNRLAEGFDVYARRPGDYELVVPITHEDGDMVDIYLSDSPRGEDYIRICDHGLTLMRLSYVYDLSTPSRQQIFESILINNGILNDNGNLYLDAPLKALYEGIMQFVGCAQKVCNMRYWRREIIRSAFYEDLEGHVRSEMTDFSPIPDESPIPNYPVTVDWSLTYNNRRFYVFGVRGNNKAKNVAIALLEFQKERLPFLSLVVHESIEDLGNKERLYLTKNADTQYPVLADFIEKGAQDIRRFASVP